MFASLTAAHSQTWIQLNPTGPTPPAQAGVNIPNCPYDSVNDRLIVFGGGFIPRYNGTWVLSNASGVGGTPNWSELSPSGTLIPQRSDSGNAYDPVNNRLIVFGGIAGSGDFQPLLNDVWVLSNANGRGGPPQWIQLNPVGGPPLPRALVSAAYDPPSNRLLIFGGCTGADSSSCNTFLGDVWVLTHANGLGGAPEWTQLQPTGTVEPRRSQATVYDTSSNRLIVFGGQEPGCNVANDVSILTNANGLGGTPQWTLLSVVSGNLQKYNHTMAYDASNNRLIVFGGASSASTCGPQFDTNDVWNLSDGNGLGSSPAWTQITPSGTPPPPAEGATGAYDPASNRLIIFGADAFNHTWVLTSPNGLRSCASDVSSQLTIVPGGFRFNHATNSFVQTVTITNTGQPLTEAALVLDSLSSNATLSNSGGTTQCAVPLGSPWVSIPGTLGTDQSVQLTLTFSDPTMAGIQYSTRVLGASGQK